MSGGWAGNNEVCRRAINIIAVLKSQQMAWRESASWHGANVSGRISEAGEGKMASIPE